MDDCKQTIPNSTDPKAAQIISAAAPVSDNRSEAVAVPVTVVMQQTIPYDSIVDIAQEGIWVVDAEGHTSFVNALMADMLGYSVDEIMHRPFFDFMDEAAKVEAFQYFARRQQGVRELHDFQFRRKDGSELWVQVSTAALMDESGGFTGAVATMTDITQRKQTEAELQQAYDHLEALVQQRTAELFQVNQQLRAEIAERQQITVNLQKEQDFLKALLSNLQAGVVACDANGLLKLLNQAAQEFHGLPDSPLPPQQWAEHYDLYLPDGVTRMQEEDIPLFQAFQGKVVHNLEMMIIPRQGTPRTLLASGRAIVAANGEKQGAVVVMHDITERKRIEAERKQAEDERSQRIQEQAARAAAEAAQRQSAFLAEVSAALSSSLDYEQTLQRVANLAVPGFADWCSVDLLNDDRTINRVAVAHVDPEKVQLGWEFACRYPPSLEDGYGIGQVMQTGESELALEVTDDLLAATIQDLEYLNSLRTLGLKSCLVVPLQAQERVLGAISFVCSDSNRHYDATDLALAEELGRRSGIAIENARLFQATQQAREAAEATAKRITRLQQVTASLSESLTPLQVSEVIVEQSMAALGACSALVALLTDTETELEIVKAVGYEPDLVNSWQRFSINAAAPLAETVRTGVPQWMESLGDCINRYPHLVEIYSRYDFAAWMSLPLMTEGKAVGGLLLSFKEYKPLSQDNQEFIIALTRQCAQAISRARLYEAEQTARAAAEQANRIKDEFLAILSHELRSPLNPILGWTQLLRRGQVHPDRRDSALETIERNARLQAQLIEDLLDISRILQGKLQLNIQAVDLGSTIIAALETVRLAAEAKQIQIYTQFLPLTGMVTGDPNRLQQVIWNLLTNAVKFTPIGGQVEVQLEQCGDFAQIQVIDTGKGITPEFLPYVFEYFRQEDGTTTRQFGGLGLGLAIVRHLIELHGGLVQAFSAGENQGATFTVCLPLVQPELTLPSQAQVVVQPGDLSGKHILIVEDDADMRELTSFILTQAGAQVMAAASATQALTLLASPLPDLLLCDIAMPEMDGYTLIKQVRSRPAHQGGQIPAIALTAFAGEANQRHALAAGFQGHLAKPVEPEALVTAIVDLLSHPGFVPPPTEAD